MQMHRCTHSLTLTNIHGTAGDVSERARFAQARELQVFEIVFILVVHQGRLRRGRVSENIFFRSNDKF